MATADNFTVMIGGSSPNGNIDSYNYYPDVVTIDAGDTITWVEGPGVHTVLIAAKGAKLPPPGSPPSLAPAGGKTFDGTGFDSSGLLTPGKTYSLTFTKPGVYTYQCGIHPDMVGAVVVQPAGSKRPLSPSQAYSSSMTQLQTDINAGEKAKSDSRLTTSKGAHGTTVYHVNTDLSSPSKWMVPLTTSAGMQTGNAELKFGKGGLSVDLSLSGKSSTSYTADIQLASSAAGASVVHSLSGFTTDAKGMGASVTMLDKVMAIPGNTWFIDVMNGSKVVASGQVDYPQYGSLRYWPNPITIHAGDSIIWTQNDGHEAHTVTFLAPGQTPQAADKYMTVKKGGNVVSGPGFFNSGLLWQGMTYELTFDKAGTYQYRCLLHDGEGMLGTVKVLPAVASSTTASGKRYTVKSGDSLWSIAAKEMGSGLLWGKLYSANKATIGTNPAAISVGEVLTIPSN